MTANAKPAITLTETDADRLVVLAETMSSRMPKVAEELLSEIDRANIVADADAPEGIVRMGSNVTYESGGETRTVTLVWPGEADISQGKISVMTPVGAALIGLGVGQSISWKANDGRENRMTVTEVQSEEVPALALV